MSIRKLWILLTKLVARGGPIREANQDSAAARRVRIGPSRSESIEPSMEKHRRNRLALSFSVQDTRIFSEQISRFSMTQDNPRARIATIFKVMGFS